MKHRAEMRLEFATIKGIKNKFFGDSLFLAELHAPGTSGRPGRAFPGNASTNFFAVGLNPSKLDPASGLIATLAWTAAWVVFAVIWVKRRNA